MSRRLIRLAAVGVAALTVGALGALPASAVGPFGPPLVLVPACEGTGGDAAISSVGTVRGFAGCGDTAASIWFFRAAPGQPTFRQQSPYTGVVLAVAWDGVSATYVVYDTGSGLRIGKRTEQGTGSFAQPTTLSFAVGATPHRADVVASAGQWWAVWSEQVGPGGEFAQRELFQRRTLLGTQPRTRITFTAANLDDAFPTLSYYGGTVTLVWARATSPALPGPSDLRIARSTGGAWSSRSLATAGDQNTDPDLLVYAGVAYVAWERDGRIVAADNASGAFTSHTFATPGADPHVGTSLGRTFVAWNTGGPVFVAERAGGVWTGAAVTGIPASAIAIPAQGGRARLIYRSDVDVRMRTQT
jgi:hypothetical protein